MKIVLKELPDRRWEIQVFEGDSVFPVTIKPTARDAAARVLQLMGVGPVSPQTGPERVGCDIDNGTKIEGGA